MMDDYRDGKDMRELHNMFNQEFIIMAEYRMLQTENLPGIYVIPSYENSFYWFGVIFVRSGIYNGGIFRFTLRLPDKFPNDVVPILTFTPPIYHPAVNPDTGVLNIDLVFSTWDSKRHHLWHILKYLNWIFNNLNVKSPANSEASVAYKTNKKLFLEKVKDCISYHIDHVYDDPPTNDKHYIVFQPYDQSIHDPAKKLMLKQTKNEDEYSNGISWVLPKTFQAFSKNEDS